MGISGIYCDNKNEIFRIDLGLEDLVLNLETIETIKVTDNIQTKEALNLRGIELCLGGNDEGVFTRVLFDDIKITKNYTVCVFDSQKNLDKEVEIIKLRKESKDKLPVEIK